MSRFSLAFALSALTLPALAQSPPPDRLRGTIEKVDGSTLTIQTRQGATATLTLDDGATTMIVRAASRADIKPDSFIGTAAMPDKDGVLHAQEVVIFPENLRGTGEGFRPWDLTPGSTMTNATVAGQVNSTTGDAVSLTYKGGEKTLVIPPDAPIVTLAPGALSDAKPGVGIIVAMAEKQADGSYHAKRITVGKDGVNPPM
ncbi:hypothetical protein [Methylovirgula sp. 4M-Z18]|uniref:hypothetical protein n=1 Tax=Methylovirgula sp. 4M-Z18 TaxID=2293567 RepID=UPI000E2F7FCD|nr:hypothetical protein [Methylovirgula sp. 4M-Z18]RFB81310.1 hypothetical protein DYH55_07700 [Methylovirgula sp. 4M-Z18]